MSVRLRKGATVGLDGGKDEVVNNMGTGDQAVLEEGAVVDTDGAGVVVASVCVRDITLIAAKGCILH